MHSDYLQFQYNDLQHSNFQFQHEGHATHVQIFRICKVYNMRIIHTLSNYCLHITDLCHLAAYICFSVGVNEWRVIYLQGPQNNTCHDVPFCSQINLACWHWCILDYTLVDWVCLSNPDFASIPSQPISYVSCGIHMRVISQAVLRIMCSEFTLLNWNHAPHRPIRESLHWEN